MKHNLKRKNSEIKFLDEFRLKTSIYRNSLFLTLKSKFFIILTSITTAFLLIFLITNIAGSFYDAMESHSFLEITGPMPYLITILIYLCAFNINVLIKFFIEERKNGIYDLEIRLGKSLSAVFFQRILAAKTISFGYIILGIALYFIGYSFMGDIKFKYLFINIYGPGVVGILFIFDTFITMLILLISFFSIIKLTSSIASIVSIFFILFPMLALAGSSTNVQINLTPSGQFSLNYGLKINELKKKYSNGIINKMLEGDETYKDFSFLNLDEWIDDNAKILAKDLNSQLVFNGLIPDSQRLLTELGVLNQNNEFNHYKTSNLIDGLTSAQSTYFNQFFQQKEELFSDKGYSYEEWQQTIFNVLLYKENLRSEENGLIRYQTVYKKQAVKWLDESIKTVENNLNNNEEKNEWKELSKIIKNAFSESYLFDLDLSNSYFDHQNFVNVNAFNKQNESDEKIIIGNEKLVNENQWTLPVLTTYKDENSKYIENESLFSYQKKIFQTLTVKPGTRQLMSITASLLANSIVVPNPIIFGLNDSSSNENRTQKETIKLIHKKQNDQVMKNPFKWLKSIYDNSNSKNVIFNELFLNKSSFSDATSLKNIYVEVEKTDKFNKKNLLYVELINKEDLNNPNYVWTNIENVNSSFNSIAAIVSIVLLNLILISIECYIYSKTLIK